MAKMSSASEGLLQARPDLHREARHRLLVVRGGESREEMTVAGLDLEVWLDRGRHLVGGADGLAGPRLRPTVRLEQAREDPVRLGAGVADHDGADDRGALDLPVIAPDLAAVLLEDRLLAPHRLDPAADVARVGVARDEPERDLLAAAPDQEREPGLDGSGEVP